MLSNFSQSRVLVAGDVMLDQYFMGSVSRISPEAPVPVVRVAQEEFRLGGAANVAANAAELKANSLLLGFSAEDSNGLQLRKLLKSAGIQPVLLDGGRPTITKSRVIGDRQQIVRLDYEQSGFYSKEYSDAALQQVQQLLDSVHVVLLSDYGKGCCSPEFCSGIIAAAQKAGVPVIVDPKTTDWSRYAGATLVTPNFKEFCEAAGEELENSDQALEELAPQVMQKFNVSNLLVTRSEKGMSLFQNEGRAPLHIHTEAREVFDVSGAGDTVIATLGVSLGAGLSMEDAVRMANKAAGIVVGKMGTTPVTFDELQQAVDEIPHESILSRDDMGRKMNLLRDQGKKIIFTNGCFDILHRGHVDYLQKARELGDVLVVGLNSDDSVRRLKGEDRPVNSEQDRAFLLAALGCVDYVCIFPEDTPEQLVAVLKPDTMVKGGDYNPDEVLGREHAREVVILKFVDGYSTTQTLSKISGN